MNEVGAEYHAIYMEQVRDQLNVTFDYAGVWNEQSLGSGTWHNSYLAQLRNAMNAKGFNRTKIVAADGDASVIDFMENEPVLRDNVDIVGIHWGQKSDSAERVAKMGKIFWNSENNDIDGPVWPDSKHSTALKWLSNVLTNYVASNMTATIICPLFHGCELSDQFRLSTALSTAAPAWSVCLDRTVMLVCVRHSCTGSMQYGRHNHGAAYTNDPWSGYYETTHAFWIQAQVSRIILCSIACCFCSSPRHRLVAAFLPRFDGAPQCLSLFTDTRALVLCKRHCGVRYISADAAERGWLAARCLWRCRQGAVQCRLRHLGLA